MHDAVQSQRRRRRLARVLKLFALAGAMALVYVYFGALLPERGGRDSVVVDVSTLAPGAITEVEGLPVPVWVLRRSQAMIASLQGDNPALVDPGSLHSRQPSAMRNVLRSASADYFVFVPLFAWHGRQPELHGYRRVRLLASATAPVECNAGERALAVGFVDESGGGVCFDYAGRVYRVAADLALQGVDNLPVPDHRLVGPGRLEIDARGLALR